MSGIYGNDKEDRFFENLLLSSEQFLNGRHDANYTLGLETETHTFMVMLNNVTFCDGWVCDYEISKILVEAESGGKVLEIQEKQLECMGFGHDEITNMLNMDINDVIMRIR